MKFRSILIISTLVSLLLAGYLFSNWYEQKKENNRLHNNFSVITDELKLIDFKHTQLLEMNKNEIKNSFPELEKKLKDDFDVKLKNLMQYSEIKTEVNHRFKVPVSEIDWSKFGNTSDSVMRAILERYKVDSVTLKTFSFKDQWLDFNAVEIQDSVFVDKNIVTVPLTQVVYKDRFRLKYLFKKRPLLQYIKSDNPYAEIKYSRTIRVSN